MADKKPNNKKPEYEPEETKESAAERRSRIANSIQSKHKFLTLRDTEELLYFNPHDGQWHDGESYLKEFLIEETSILIASKKTTITEFTTSMLREVKEIIKIQTYIDPKTFVCPPEWINLKNGALNVLSAEFIQRDPEPMCEDLRQEIEKLKRERDLKLKEVKDTPGTMESYNIKDSISEDYSSRIRYINGKIREKKEEWRKSQTEKFAKFYFTSSLPVKFDPSAACPKIDAFFHQLQNKEDEAKRLYELTGYMLYKGYPLKKLFILYGGTNTGKTTLATELWQKRFLGIDNVSTLSIGSIQEDKFDRIKLRNKYANISPELPENTHISDTGQFKMLTGNDMMSARLMHSQKEPQFVNFAKIIFLTNHIPVISETDDAFFKRVEIIEFNNQFEDGKNAIKNIIQKIADESELSGLLNVSLKALQELMERGTFTASKKAEDKKSEYLLKSNPIRFFLQERYDFYYNYPGENDPDVVQVKKADVYADYVQFCKMNGILADTQNRFFRIANRYFKDMGIESRRISNGGPECYIGIFPKKELVELQVTGKQDDINKDIASYDNLI